MVARLGGAFVAGRLVQQHQGLGVIGPGLALDRELEALDRQLGQGVVLRDTGHLHLAVGDQGGATASRTKALAEQDLRKGLRAALFHSTPPRSRAAGRPGRPTA